MMDDLQLLRDPISEEFPAGEGLRYEGTYDQIQEARREDDSTLSQGIWQTSLKRADWETVQRLALDALTRRTKDLQIAVWLLEARTELYGFAGVRSGLEILHLLCETFWDDLFPKIEEGDIEYRLYPIEWINGKLTLRLKGIAITNPSNAESRPYSWADLEAAGRLENLARKDQKLAREAEQDEHQVTMTKFDASMMLTPDAHLNTLLADVQGSLDALDRFRELLRELCGDLSPSLAKFREPLESVRNLVMTTLHGRGVSPHQVAENFFFTEGDDEQPHADGAHQAGHSQNNGMPELRSRHEAYAMLAAIADYLMRIEPHSPTPYLVKRAVAWGSMPLPELLVELMDQQGDLSKIYTLLGIRG